jgi:N-carbamoylputrescine amidase
MTSFRVALLQLAGHGTDQRANLAAGDAACRRARELGADVALFPEMWNVAYTRFWPEERGDRWRAPHRWTEPPPPDPPELEAALDEWRRGAIGPDDPFVRHFRDLARQLNMAIALTYLERWPGKPRNSVSLIDRRGEVLFTYAKVHTCAFDRFEDALTSGDAFPVAALDTASGPVNVGAMICYDREFPESARILMLNGAKVILTPNACTLEPNRLGQFRARALENMVGVAMANYAAPDANGHSVAYDPIGYDGEGRSRDTLLVEAGETEGVYLATFDLDRIREWREAETFGAAFRRPRCYAPLVAAAVEPPFVRVDAAGRAWSDRDADRAGRE